MPQLIFLNLLVQFRQISKISMLFMNTLSVLSDQNFHIWGTASPESQVVYQWGGGCHPTLRSESISPLVLQNYQV